MFTIAILSILISIQRANTAIDSYLDASWTTGVASAYGGSSDSASVDNQITYTEERIHGDSMGVAIPMSWDRSLIGKHVQIRYQDQIVNSCINDIGYLGGGSRDLDLQPGIFHQFGYDTCDEWGIRTVEYRIIDRR